MKKRLLSIVIANYNYGRFLEEAIQSVIAQGMGDKVELIICDAASTDNSVEIIKKYARGLPPNTELNDWQSTEALTADSQMLTTKITWWCSEKDGGQSAAFNKGFSHAQGEWISWLNADDILMPRTLCGFEELVRNKSKADWITGNKLHFDSNSRKIMSIHWGPHSLPPFLRGNTAFSAVYGPTTFWKKSLYNRLGPIDESLFYAMDSEYWARMTMAGIRQIRFNHICWGFRVHEESKTEGIQSSDVFQKRKSETSRWRERLGYKYNPSFSNPWYLLWVLWRILDLSFVLRAYFKFRYEGCSLDDYMEVRK